MLYFVVVRDEYRLKEFEKEVSTSPYGLTREK
jgi:hypothetical protein